ncbi:MAG TPA: PD-(D/E)XK nuclease family protein [Candidatus Pacearchaeota archaeon]|nr:PD-(D/E)XK nuclease family protein [Candidatus Pacearchaeota archaeon]
MSKYYNPNKASNKYIPGSSQPFRISRSKIDLFLECPRCFYLDRTLGIGRPPGYPFSLNSAVDALLKKEFDFYRERSTPHPLMKEYGINAIPFQHEKMEEWRDSLRRGITYLHQPTNLIITGGVDDVWVNPQGELIIVDYKATSKNGEVNIDAEWQDSYKRQMEVYQWLFRQNNFRVSSVGYFVYCNGDTDRESFDNTLNFDIKVIPYEGDDSWIEKTINDIYVCLNEKSLPEPGDDCDFCKYRNAVKILE